MLNSKIILRTIGEKIKPYGFEYKGYECFRWTFQREAVGKVQSISIVIQNYKMGGRGFQIEINMANGCSWRKKWELLGDFMGFFFYDSREELEELLLSLGKGFEEVVIPRLPEACMPEYGYEDTNAMREILKRDKEILIQRFLEENPSAGEEGLLICLAKKVEQIKGKAFAEIEGQLIQLAAVYGYVFIRELWGEWDKNGLFIENIVPNFCVNVLRTICRSAQRDGGSTLVMDYVRQKASAMQWAEEGREMYGEDWELPANGWQEDKNSPGEKNPAEQGIPGLEQIISRLEQDGFSYRGRGCEAENFRKGNKEDGEYVVSMQPDKWGRSAFFTEVYRYKEERVRIFRKFSWYRPEDMGGLLEGLADDIMSAIETDKEYAEPRLHKSFTRRCIVNEEMNNFFCKNKELMAGQFRKENGLDGEAGEEDALDRIRLALDGLEGREYGEIKEELMKLAAVYGELIIRNIGGSWGRSHGKNKGGVYLRDIPVMRDIQLLEDFVWDWEYGGSGEVVKRYRGYVRQRDEWLEICRRCFGEDFSYNKDEIRF